MIREVSGFFIPTNLGLPFVEEITTACAEVNFPPCVAYAIKVNESGLSNDSTIMQYGSVGDFMPNGSNAGHGIFQLTYSWPSDWANALTNARYALTEFLMPAWKFWIEQTSVEGYDLVKVVAASFNAGIETAYQWHLEGDVDLHTSNRYGSRAVKHYLDLIAGVSPTP